MNDREERALIKEATHEAAVEILLALGVDISDPQAVREMQADMRWLRRGRMASENMPGHIKKAGLGTLAAVLGYIIWSGVQNYLTFLR